MEKIFISYRREDSADVAGRIYDALKAHFGGEWVFKDVDKIPFGTDFRVHLDGKVSQCRAFLVIIGRHWLDVTNARGGRRLDDTADFVRVEIESALRRGIPVIPLLVHGTDMPPVEELPASLHDLAYRNGVPVRADPDFHNDMRRLIGALEQQLGIPAGDAQRVPDSDVEEDVGGSGGEGRENAAWRRVLRPGPLLAVALGSALLLGAWAIGRWPAPAPDEDLQAAGAATTPRVGPDDGVPQQARREESARQEDQARLEQDVRRAERLRREEQARSEHEARLARIAAERSAAMREAADREAADREASDRKAADREAAARETADRETAERIRLLAEAKAAAEASRREDEERVRLAALREERQSKAGAEAKRLADARERARAEEEARVQATARAEEEARAQALARAAAEARAKAQADAVARARQEVRLAIFPHEADHTCFYPVGARMEDAANSFSNGRSATTVSYSWYRAGSAPPGLGEDTRVWQGNAVIKEPSVQEVQAVARTLGANAVLMGWYECSDAPGVDDYHYQVDIFLVDTLSGRVYHRRSGLFDTASAVSDLLAQMTRDRG